MSSLIKIEDGVFLCEHCGEEYTRNTDLERHLPCLEKSRLCETVTDKQKELAFNEDSQVVVIKKEIQELLCGNCGKDISEEYLNIHNDDHSTEVLYLCKECRHLIEHDDNIELGLLQEVDKNTHDSASEMIKNMQLKETSNTDFTFNDIQDKSYQCEHCGEEYTNNEELLRHLKAHVSDRKYEVKLNKEDLRAHITETDKALIEHEWADWKEFGNNFEQNKQYTVKGTTSEEAKKLEIIKGNTHGLEDVNITDLDTPLIDEQEKLYNYKNFEEKYVNNEELLMNKKTHTGSKFEFRLIKEDLRIYEKEKGKVQCQIKFVFDKQVKKTSEGSIQEFPYFKRNLENSSNFQDCLNSDTIADASTQCKSREDITSSVPTGHNLGGNERVRNINGYHIKRHLQIFHTEKQYECQHCKKRFAYNCQLIAHLRVHTGEKPYKCRRCGKGFARNGILKSHMRIHTAGKPFECRHCGKKFTQSSSLKEHMWRHTGEKSYECTYCDKKFAKKGGLRRHLMLHTGNEPFKCEHCEKIFRRKRQLTDHMAIHTGVKPYDECEDFQKKFTQHLKEHLHTEEKQYECQHCGRKFAKSATLKSHFCLAIEKPFECKDCRMMFTQRSTLKEHLSTHTVEKPYECQHCKNRFRQKRHLTAHLVVHTKRVEPYECEYCFKKFFKLSNFNDHLMTHAGDKPYECQFCSKKFKHKGTLIMHLDIHKAKKKKLLCCPNSTDPKIAKI